MARTYHERDLKLLWGLAAARCGFPACKAELAAAPSETDASAVIGEIAHIVASSGEGPRADAALPPADRDRYENLLLLCPTHHTLVDKQSNTFRTIDLRQWKADHENWVRQRLASEMPNVSFAELEVLTAGIVNAPARVSIDFSPLDLSEKMARNGLTNPVRFQLTMGLSKAREVQQFVAHVAMLDPNFPEKLKAGFVAEYRSLRAREIEGDALFQGLHGFAASGRSEFLYRAAGLAVLAHLFEACEVFER